MTCECVCVQVYMCMVCVYMYVYYSMCLPCWGCLVWNLCLCGTIHMLQLMHFIQFVLCLCTSVCSTNHTHTVDLKIFVVKIFSWFAQTMKIKNTKYILQWIIIYIARTFLSFFTAQLASYFARDSLFDISRSLELMANAWQLFAQCSINCLSLLPQYVPTASFGSLLHPIVIRQELTGSHEFSTQAVRTPRFLSVGSLVPDH